LFGGYRQMFGGVQYNGRVIRGGFSAALDPSWEVTATVYNAEQAVFNNYRDIWSWVFDVAYHGPRNLLVVAGVGYSPTISNLDLHARTILPVTDRVALQLIAGYNSLNTDTRLTAGLRFNW
jgi:long-subunit fatty acid transport protein